MFASFCLCLPPRQENDTCLVWVFSVRLGIRASTLLFLSVCFMCSAFGCNKINLKNFQITQGFPSSVLGKYVTVYHKSHIILTNQGIVGYFRLRSVKLCALAPSQPWPINCNSDNKSGFFCSLISLVCVSNRLLVDKFFCYSFVVINRYCTIAD
jgi:hypothetical protein